MRSWKTTLAGLVILLIIVSKTVENPRVLLQSETIIEILMGFGLILAKDFNISGTILRQKYPALSDFLIRKEEK